MSTDLLFDGIETIVPGNQGGTPLTEGEYLVNIEDVQYLKTQRKGDAFIVEFTVKESSDLAKHPLDVKRSWYQPMKELPIALSEIVKFVHAVAGFDSKRDEERIKAEVTPNIKAWTNAACRKPSKDAEGKDVPGKIFNGLPLRITVKRKPPKADKVALVEAINAALPAGTPKQPMPIGFLNLKFSPASQTPPPPKAS